MKDNKDNKKDIRSKCLNDNFYFFKAVMNKLEEVNYCDNIDNLFIVESICESLGFTEEEIKDNEELSQIFECAVNVHLLSRGV